MENLDETGTKTAERPVFLTVLCILSFIAAGISILVYGAAFALIGAASATASGMSSGLSGEAGEAFEKAMEAASPSVGLIWAYIIVGFVTVILSLIGVIKMWKLQKSGFMMYVVAAVGSIVMSVVYAGVSASIGGIIFSVLFIVLYGLNLKHLK